MKLIKLFIPAVSVAFALIAGACHDMPEGNNVHAWTTDVPIENFVDIPKGTLVYCERDFNILNSLISSKKTTAFEIKDRSLYRVLKAEDGHINEWLDLSDGFIGGILTTPGRFVLGNDKVWTPMHLFSSTYGPSAFAVALGAVNKRLHKNYYVYAARTYNIDTEASTITISGIPYELMQITKDQITFNSLQPYKDDKGKQILEIAQYEINTDVSIDDGKNLGFDSVEDAYNWLIDLFRENFGEKVNLNTLYYPDIILDQPYFYISGLESERDMYVNASAK